MKQFAIYIGSFADIRDFVALAIAQPFEVLVGSGDRLVNAKSLMAMFSLNYRLPLQVSVRCDDEAYTRFTTAAAKFIA
jgi:hypothetical protein